MLARFNWAYQFAGKWWQLTTLPATGVSHIGLLTGRQHNHDEMHQQQRPLPRPAGIHRDTVTLCTVTVSSRASHTRSARVTLPARLTGTWYATQTG